MSTKADFIAAAERKLDEIRYYEGGSLRLKAYEMADIMHELIAWVDTSIEVPRV